MSVDGSCGGQDPRTCPDCGTVGGPTTKRNDFVPEQGAAPTGLPDRNEWGGYPAVPGAAYRMGTRVQITTVPQRWLNLPGALPPE